MQGRVKDIAVGKKKKEAELDAGENLESACKCTTNS